MDTINWLLQGDPAIRWQVLADLVDAEPDDVAAERARVAREGWGAQLLALQEADGRWDGGTYRPGWASAEDRPFYDAWSATHFVLQQLVDLGVDPADESVCAAIDLVERSVRWEHAGERYFDGEVEPCVNGVALTVAAYFRRGGSQIVATGLAGQLGDGGWNCWESAAVSSVHSTICMVEGLLAWEQANPDASNVGEVSAARARGEEYLLQRSLFRRVADGSLMDPRFTMTSYPVRWYYDVLRALEHMRTADMWASRQARAGERPSVGVGPGRRDARLAEAVELLRAKQGPDGLWRNELHHEGPQLVRVGAFERDPCRWTTLRALRVLRWWDSQ